VYQGSFQPKHCLSIPEDNLYDGKQELHCLGNSGKEGKWQAHLYNVPKIPPLAFSLSSMHTKVAPNILRGFRMQK